MYLCHQRWRSYRNIQFIRKIPILFLSSGKDELVPPSHMAKLHMAANTRSGKVWREFEHATHNDTCMQVRGKQARWWCVSADTFIIGRILWDDRRVYTGLCLGNLISYKCTFISSSSSSSLQLQTYHTHPFIKCKSRHCIFSSLSFWMNTFYLCHPMLLSTDYNRFSFSAQCDTEYHFAQPTCLWGSPWVTVRQKKIGKSLYG